MSDFYCQKVCGAVGFSIDEWNAALKQCDELGIEGEERDRILHPDKFPCEKQCWSCIEIVLRRRLKTQHLLHKQNT